MRWTGLLILVGMLGSGCAPQAAFKPETIEVKKHSLVIKGWTHKDQFCIELELKPGNKMTSLHSVALVTPDGKKLAPGSWDDRTPEPPRMSVGFGVGGIGGGGGDRGGGDRGDGGRGGGGVGMGMGVGFPLGGGRGNKITAIEACWRITKSIGPITECTLEVSLVSVVIKKAEVTTVPLAMVWHPEEKPKEGTTTDKPAKDKPAKDIVREIDFTQKGPIKTKSQTL